MKLHNVTAFLDAIFQELTPEDYSNNGLQVEASQEITKIAFAVDASLQSFQMALEQGAQLLVVHHGISWGNGFKRVLGYEAIRFQTLFQNGLSLYAQHLPLDMHPDLGNNAVLASILELQDKIPFGDVHGNLIGAAGNLPKPLSLASIARIMDKNLATNSNIPVDCGKLVRTVGIVSGGGDDAIFEAAEKGIDCLVTGEFRHQFYHPAKELGVSVVASGHYATETTGPWALMQFTQQELQLPCTFLKLPTGL